MRASMRRRFLSGVALVAGGVLVTPAIAQTGAASQSSPVPGTSADQNAPASIPATTSSGATTGNGDQSSGQTAEIVVTAQGRTQRLQDVPVAVSVVQGAALAKQNIVNLDALSARLPAVKIVSGPITDLLNIRGVGSGQNIGFEQSVGTFVDGVYRGRSKSTRAALFDIDRVEVLKGPQTTFFGNNTVAGALNITTRKPGDTFQYNATGYYGFEYGDYTAEAGVTVPLRDNLSIRVAGQATGMDGYIDNKTVDDDAPRQRNLLGRISLRWQPTDRLETNARFDIGHQRNRNAFSAIVLDCPSPLAGAGDFACPFVVADRGGPTGNKPYYTSYARPSYANYDFKEGEVTNALDLGGATLTSITGYFQHHYDSRVQLVPVSAGGVDGYDLAPSPVSERIEQVSQELRLQSATGGTIEYMIGGYYSHLSTQSDAGFGAYFLPFGAFNPLGTTDASTPVTALNSQRYRDQTLSAFGALTIRPIDRLRVNLGLRYTNVLKKAHRSAIFGTAPNADLSQLVPFDPVTQSVFAAILGSDSADFPDPRRRDARFLPSAGIQYDLTSDIMAYATYSRGFKAGGFSGQSTISVFGPETVNAYEAGLKTQLFDHHLTLNVDVFRSDYKDLQETTITFNPLPVSGVSNAAASRTQGVEASADWRITSNLRLTSDIAYLDAKYQNYANGVCTAAQTAATQGACLQDLSGSRRPYSPRWSGNVGAEARLPFTAGTSLRVSPLLYFSGAFFTTATADPLLRQGAFAKVDLRVSYGPDNGRWELAVVGKNIADKATASYRSPLTGGNGSVFALPDPPRSIALQFSIKG